MIQNYLPTGNEMISLPKINEQTAGIEDFTFLHMGYKGLIDVRGSDDLALIQPFVSVDGKEAPLQNLQWSRLYYWIPQFTATVDDISVKGIILTPVEERGFAVGLELHNKSNQAHTIKYGMHGKWQSSWHCVNEDKPIEGTMHCYESAWNNSLVFDVRSGVPMFCFAPMSDVPCTSSFERKDDGVQYQLFREETIAPNSTCCMTIYWGLGFEEVAATTSAKEMVRQGFAYELERTKAYLVKRSTKLDDEKLTELYNTNMFFCIFYSTGITLDTEELVLVTSRSPRYYVSAAYWDRDSLLWSFPAILDADAKLARQMLEYVFGRQRRNIGVHSRFIDGTVLEPGFELDELMAPVLALESYIRATQDLSILGEPNVQKAMDEILDKLESRKHHTVALYSTFLQPTDDEHVYPYLTYNNVLVWKALCAVSKLFPSHTAAAAQADEVKAAIAEHCVKVKDGKHYYAWSVDLEGRHDIYDEPPGSLQLLPHFGFCSYDDEVYQNTVDMIRSPDYAYSFAGCNIAEIGCPHAPHPWMLSVANSLICGRIDHCKDILLKVKMDNMIACESIDETTGECTTGEAFATCAGFLCHAIKLAFGGGKPNEK